MTARFLALALCLAVPTIASATPPTGQQRRAAVRDFNAWKAKDPVAKAAYREAHGVLEIGFQKTMRVVSFGAAAVNGVLGVALRSPTMLLVAAGGVGAGVALGKDIRHSEGLARSQALGASPLSVALGRRTRWERAGILARSAE